MWDKEVRPGQRLERPMQECSPKKRSGWNEKRSGWMNHVTVVKIPAKIYRELNSMVLNIIHRIFTLGRHGPSNWLEKVSKH